MNFSGRFVVLSDYVSEASEGQLSDQDLLDSVRGLAATGPTRESLRQLSILSHYANNPSHQPAAVESYAEGLESDAQLQFRALSKDWRMFGTQPVLKAIAEVMMEIESKRKYPTQGMAHSAILLTHSVGEQLQRQENAPPSGRLIGGLESVWVFRRIYSLEVRMEHGKSEPRTKEVSV